MRARILHTYITTEIIPGFLINILVFTSIMLMARVMDLTNLVIAKGVGLGVVGRILLLATPKALSMTLPMATLLAVLTAFLRLSADSELTVIRASGVSLYQLLPPVLGFGLISGLLTAMFTVWLAPEASWRFKTELLALAKTRADLALQEQVFIRSFPGLVIYVNQLAPGSDRMHQVFIGDQRNPEEKAVIVAQNGRLGLDRNQGVLLFHLEDGVIDRVYRHRPEADSVAFQTYELKVSPGEEFESAENALTRGRSELPGQLLLERAAENPESAQALSYVMEWHRRLSFPVGAFIMALVGLPLGASFRVRGRNFAMVMGLGLFVLYYALFTTGWSMGEARLIPPVISIWTPNAVLALVGLGSLRHAGRGMAVDPLDFPRRLLGLSRRGRLSTPVKP